MPELSRKDEQARRRARLREQPAMPRVDAALPGYAELHCLTHFSFQRGASSPEELVRRAHALGYAALAVTDECSVAGAVQAWRALADLKGDLQGAAAGQAPGLPHLIHGSEFRFAGQGTLVALARDRPGWGDLCAFISACRRAAPKGQYRLPPLAEALAALARCECLWAPARVGEGGFAGLEPAVAKAKIPLLLELHADAGDALWQAHMQRLAAASGCPLVAAGDVHMHARGAKRLHDVMCAIRLGRPVQVCGFALHANAERHLRARERLAEIYPPALLAATLAIAARCTFRLDEIRYDYPRESVLPGLSPTQTLRRHTVAGAHERYPRGVPMRIWRYLAKELRLIAECRYEMFFLTVHDIVCFAKGRGILCQGRGSAANSVVCFCLGITAADPEQSHPLLERFISKARQSEPPDIDVDFEHARREEVIQYIYGKYGRERAALAAAVIAWRSRSALRDVGAALGVDARLVDAFAKDHHGFDGSPAAPRLLEMAQALQVDLPAALARQWLELAAQLRGRPRHLSQHVGGFVLTETPLTRLVPIEPAAMEGRSVIQWDKDDLEALGLLKVDVLALGMLTAVRRCIDLVARWRGQPFTRYDIQGEDAATYAMIRRADTVGTFQIESRAQMSMLPRLKPTTFYDLVVQVAIVRPGPISGGMVHPYLKARERQRQGLPIEYERSHHDRPGAKPRLARALERTLGVPIFQEQVMELSMLAAGFSAEKADRLRRAMAAWKKKGGLEPFERELIEGMRARGYSAEFAQRIFEQIKGFGEYGFPESHAWSFALIAYESAWLKCHEPEAYLAAMLNAQPMGFYGPAQLVQDARRHGVVVLPADVSASDWDCTLADPHPNPKKLGSDQHFSGQQPSSRPAVRLGLRMVRALAEAAGRRIAAARAARAFVDVDDLARRAALDTGELNQLAAADALTSLAGHRRQQVWQAAALKAMPALLRDAPIGEAPLALPAAGEGEAIVHDYAALGLTLRRHPLALLRPRLARQRLLTAAELQHLPSGRWVRACGLVTGRQRPATAKGTIFVTLEDETGPVNVIVWPSLREDEAQRHALLRAQLLAVEGQWQRDEGSGGQVRHLVARRLHDLTPLLGRLAGLTASRDFH
ncbi:MAG: error-prone DNA polymerase [Proteobacteria bacterium]|nr:error-prone DNA polymerase [Pseudomonadota bacterium]